METKQVKLAQPLIPLCVALLLVSQNASLAQTPQQNSAAQPPQQGVTVPEGGTYVIDFGNAPVFNANGNFTNAGTVYALSTNPAVTTGTLVSIDFFNHPGAVFTSVLPTGGIPGYTSTVSNLNLVLTAINNFTNAGIISSSGSLNISAGGTITNALPTGMTASAPLMTALMGDIALQASNIVNSGQIVAQMGSINAFTANLLNNLGTMQSMTGSLNIRNIIDSNLVIGNSAGTLSALKDVVMSTIPGSGGITVSGGTLAGTDISLISPQGAIAVTADHINGRVNLTGKSAVVSAQSSNLTLNTVQLTEDPIFAASNTLDLSGIFSGGSTFYTYGDQFAALAGQNIIAPTAPSGATVNALDTSTGGGPITIAAGVDYSLSGKSFTISGPSKSGGSVSLPGVSFVTRNNNIAVSAYQGGSESGSIDIGNLRSSTTAGASKQEILISADGNIVTKNIANDNGLIQIVSNTGNVSILDTCALQAFNGSLIVRAERNIAMQGAVLDAVGGNIRLDAYGVLLNCANKLSAYRQSGVGGNVEVTASGNVYSGDKNSVNAVGGNISFVSPQGTVQVGTDNSFLACGSGDAQSTSGNIEFDSSATSLGNANQLNAKGGSIGINSRNANLTVGSNNVLNTFPASSGATTNIRLETPANILIGDHNQISANGGNVELNAGKDVSLGNANTLNAYSASNNAGGSVKIVSSSGRITLQAQNIANAVGGEVLLTSPIGITTGTDTRLVAFSGPGTGSISIVSTGTIALGGGSNTSSVGGDILMDASSVTLGPDGKIVTFGTNPVTGNISIRSNDPLSLSRQTVEAAGDIDLRSGGGITATESIVNAKDGKVSMHSLTDGDIIITRNNRIYASDSTELATGGNIIFGQNGQAIDNNRLCVDKGSIALLAGKSILMGYGNSIQSNRGEIKMTATSGDVHAGRFNTMAAGGGDLALTSTKGNINLGSNNILNAFYSMTNPGVGGNILLNAKVGKLDLGTGNKVAAVGGNIELNSTNITWGTDNRLCSFPREGNGGSVIASLPGAVDMTNEKIAVTGNFVLTAPTINITDSWITAAGGDIRLTTTVGDLMLLATKDNTTILTAYSTAFLPGFSGDFSTVSGGNILLNSVRNVELEGKGVGVQHKPAEPGTNTLYAYGGNIVIHADTSIDLKFDNVLISQKYHVPGVGCVGPGGGIYMTTGDVATPSPLPLPNPDLNVFAFSDKTKIAPNQPSFSNQIKPSDTSIHQESDTMSDRTVVDVRNGGEITLNGDESLVHILSSDLTANDGIILLHSGGKSNRYFIQIKDSSLLARCGENPPPPPICVEPERPNCQPPIPATPPEAPIPPMAPVCPTPPLPGPNPPGPPPLPPPPPATPETTVAPAPSPAVAVSEFPAIELKLGNYVVSQDKCTGWFVQDMKESYLQMTSGTKLAVSNGKVLSMANGSMLVKAGNETLTVRAGSSQIKLSPSSIALIDAPESAPSQIVALDAAGSEGITVKLKGEEHRLLPGDSLVISAPPTQLAQATPKSVPDTLMLHGGVDYSPVYSMKASVHLPEFVPKLVFLQCRNCAFTNYLKSQMVADANRPRPGLSLSELVRCKVLPAAALKEGRPKGSEVRITSETKMSEVTRNVFELKQGAALMMVSAPTRVTTPHATVFLKPGSIVLLSAARELSRVRDLSDQKSKSVQIQVGNNVFPLIPGSEASITRSKRDAMALVLSDGIARRNFRQVTSHGAQVIVNEFSLLDALASHPVMDNVRYAQDQAARQITGTILKTAAAIAIVIDRQRGPYFSPSFQTGLASKTGEPLY